ncbi:DUF4113 domain-containing protein [Salmonella enterica]|nr:DUF4113 domain-containing protein [Salmonella enterica]HAU2793859.1 DUF4113 domain-containing protein [Salmonella enterica subsp. houtenae]EGC3593175.1 DUF4113 domain-containing protein [Salmonella enterica]EGD1561811.1 DUF4113 domain-containing protein [Salmonella enterica]EGH9377652.1 DUF4113 domain-containing protein [Salmonella enterica]
MRRYGCCTGGIGETSSVWAWRNFFDDNAPRASSEKLMEVLDHLNAKEGRGALYFAGEGILQQWTMKREMLSLRCTTRYSDLLRVK